MSQFIIALATRSRGYTNKVHLRGLRENQGFVNLRRQVKSRVAATSSRSGK